MWMKQIIKDIWIEVLESVIIYCDNRSIVSMSKNHVLHYKTKYVSIKHHVLRDKVAEKEIRLECVNTKDKIVYIIAKPLPKDTFDYL